MQEHSETATITKEERMTAQVEALAPTNPAAEPEFDLDVSIVESGRVLTELLRATDDGCGTTCESACPASCP